MTLRLCIIGNSHVAALREAYLRNPNRWPGISASFVGAPQGMLGQTAIRDGCLVPTTDRARETWARISRISRVVLADHDAFVIVGCAVALVSALPLYRDARWMELPSVGVGVDVGLALISHAAALASLRVTLSTRQGVRLAGLLRSGTDRPILLAGQPRVSAAILTMPRPDMRLHKVAIRNGDAAALSAAFDRAATEVLHQSDTQFLPQPHRSTVQHVLTARRYIIGANRLAGTLDLPQACDDIMHANAAYGALVLDQIATALGLFSQHGTTSQTGAGPDFAQQRSALRSTG